MKLANTIEELYSKPARWIQGDEAGRKEKGEFALGLSATGSEANCFCLYGAVQHVYREPKEQRDVVNKLALTIRAYTHRLYKNYDSIGVIIHWNDTRGRRIRDIRRVVKLAGV
jgi:hypothetical protein